MNKDYKFPIFSVKDSIEQIKNTPLPNHPPKVLILYGSIRAGSISKMLATEAMKILQSFGAEVRVFNPENLPIFDSVSSNNHKVMELRELVIWSEAMVWCSPELHGTFLRIKSTGFPYPLVLSDRHKEKRWR